MKLRIPSLLVLSAFLLLTVVGLGHAQSPQVQQPLGTAFTYQGQLNNNGLAISGDCDFQFSLWDAASDGAQIGSTLALNGVQITRGRFTVALDFGAGAFTGESRWLGIEVRCPAGSGPYTPLAPRQALTPTPYALALPGLRTEPNATSPNVVGGYSGNSAAPGAVGATIAGGGQSAFPNHVAGAFASVGGGAGNTARGNYAIVSGGGSNLASDWLATVSGGGDNAAKSYYATVGGGTANIASGLYATVGGGGNNKAQGESATVGGGDTNASSGYRATVAGGGGNTASGWHAAIGGGWYNTASGEHSTIAGGNYNTATNLHAVIGGGWYNTASGQNATVPGGNGNRASGNYSMAAGRRANASHAGAFVWADATDADFSSSAANEFAVRAAGGVRFVTSGAGATVDGNLRVTGNYVQFPTVTGSEPPADDCDEPSEAGRMVVRTDGDINLYVCLGIAGWVGK